MSSIRQTDWCNPDWKHFEKVGDGGQVKKEYFVREVDDDHVVVRTKGLFGIEKERDIYTRQVGDRIIYTTFNEYGRQISEKSVSVKEKDAHLLNFLA